MSMKNFNLQVGLTSCLQFLTYMLNGGKTVFIVFDVKSVIPEQ